MSPTRRHRHRHRRPVRHPTGSRPGAGRRPGTGRLRRRLRRELGWLLVAAGVAGLVLIAVDAWTLPSRHRWDVVAAAVVLVWAGLRLLTLA